MYIVKTPSLLQPISKDLLWKVETLSKEIFLTFDDGPTPGVTDIALDMMAAYDAKATFFCLGKNAMNYPDLFQRIWSDGHQIGNHTFDHPDGWKTSTVSYLRNVIKARKFISSALFRPPYGRITPAQINAIKGKFKIVMWQVLSADFDQNITKEICLRNVISNAESGSIVVFHDSIKAKDNLLFALQHTLEHISFGHYKIQHVR
jgi:peptidoglycan-N-acetylglucosamine deacetylase